jgi:outer membrane PBP1 activator LpoA protein
MRQQSLIREEAMRTFSVVIVGAAMLFAGCGNDGASDSGQSDEVQIQAVADTYSQAALDGDTAAACETFSSEALAAIEEIKEFDGCEDLVQYGFGILDDSQKAEIAEITDIQVEGDTATAEGRDGTINFIKEDGEWKQQIQSQGS